MAMAASKAQQLEWRLVLVLPLLNCFPPWPSNEVGYSDSRRGTQRKKPNRDLKGTSIQQAAVWGIFCSGELPKGHAGSRSVVRCLSKAAVCIQTSSYTALAIPSSYRTSVMSSLRSSLQRLV